MPSRVSSLRSASAAPSPHRSAAASEAAAVGRDAEVTDTAANRSLCGGIRPQRGVPLLVAARAQPEIPLAEHDQIDQQAAGLINSVSRARWCFCWC